jgi:hypothetical protein
MIAEIADNCSARSDFNFVIGIKKRAAQLLRQPSSNGGFTHAHQAN